MATAFDAQPTKLRPLQVAAPDVERWLLDRDPAASGAYGEMGRDEYARAFTAAQTAGHDVVNDLYFAMVDVFARSGTEQDYSNLVVPILKSKGWLKGDDGAIAKRVALIYDTNLRLARAAGRWDAYQASRFALPYVRGVTAEDERVRHPPKSPHSDHRAFEGIVLPLNHPFVAKYWTPLGFRCRCIWVQMSRSEMARRKLGITSEDELADREQRLGPPVFASPAEPIEATLDAMVAPSNDREPRMPGLPSVDPLAAKRSGGDIWDTVLRAQSLDALGKQLAHFLA